MPNDKADRPHVSRRTVVGVGVATPALSPALANVQTGEGDLVDRCAAFLAVDVRIERLTSRWGALETMAADAHKAWWDLAEDQRRALPEGREMADIDQTLKGLFRERERLLKGLPELATSGADGLLGKLVVAARAIHPDDEPLIHGLLAEAARDLAHMHCPACNRPLTRDDVRQFVETLS